MVTQEVTPNKGTPQYWRLFNDTVCEPTPTSHIRLLKTGEKNPQQRVHNKLDLLKKMQRAGIWLVDASVTALYGNGIKLTKSHSRDVLKACWGSHIREVLRGCAPSAILIVGKGVESAIGGAVRQSLGCGIEVVPIYQPNARQFGEVDRLKCFNLCSRHRAVCRDIS